MFRASSAIIKGASKACQRTFSTYKTSTGLVGLAVDPNGRETLLTLSAQIKEAVKVRVRLTLCTKNLHKEPLFLHIL